MKRGNHIVWFAVMLAAILFSCQGKKSAEKPEFVDFVSGLTHADTVAVENLVTGFMTFVQGGQYNEAAAMLYKANPENAWKEPLLLNNDELQETARLLQTFTVKNYEIVGLKFKTAVENEVTCRMTLREATATSPAVVRKMCFKPMNYLGKWILCLKDSSNGDKPLE